MLPIYRKNWHDMLGVDFGTEIGPSNVSLEDFEKHALRCGRIIELAGNKQEFTHMKPLFISECLFFITYQ